MTMLIGHMHALNSLQAQLAAGIAGQTYVFSGPKGVGKNMLAERFVHGFLKGIATIERQTPKDGVWSRMQAGTHGNFKKIERLPLDTGKLAKDISVDTIRKAMNLFAQSSFEPGGRAMIINSCDDLTRQAANSLLKLLEEPPSQCLIILINHHAGQLLPTLRSRAQQISFNPLSIEQLQDVCTLNAWSTSFIDLAMGAPGVLHRLNQFLTPSLVNQFNEGIDHLANGHFTGLVKFIEAFMAYADKQEDMLDTFHLFVTGWLGHHIILKAKNKRFHKIYAHACLGTLAKRWFSINQQFHEAGVSYLDPKQTMVLALKALDPNYALPASPFQPWHTYSS